MLLTINIHTLMNIPGNSIGTEDDDDDDDGRRHTLNLFFVLMRKVLQSTILW